MLNDETLKSLLDLDEPEEDARVPVATTPRSADSLSDLWLPEDDEADGRAADLGELLLQRKAIDAAQLSAARGVSEKTPGKSLADIFLDSGVEELAIQQAAADLAGLTLERVDHQNLAVRLIEKLGHDFCRDNGVLPLRTAGTRLVLGITHANRLLVIDEVSHKLGVRVKPVVVLRADIAEALESLKEEEETTLDVDEIISDIEEDDVEVVQQKEEEMDLEKMAGESPVIRLVNYLIFNAVKEGASDIHIEPQEKKLKIRYRIDGLLFESMNPPHHMHAAIISRLKVMANLDISERRLPQDGRIRAMVHGRKLDLRLSTLPTASGEKAVLRILDTRSIKVSLEDLGMGEDALLMWKRQIDQPHGILLVTGPTGSGKTTTLYSSLSQMDRQKLNISTVEDPVEYHLNGINQVQAYERIGMTFATALRAMLRQDPDVVMIGEIRDKETATIAIQASLTGHLVLSTLHTNDAPSTITRLINIGVEPYLIASAVNATLAQRLVRRVCHACRKQVPTPPQLAEVLEMQGMPMPQVWVGQGCAKCRNTGYAGRLGLFEILILDDTFRDMITSAPSVTEFRRRCVERGMATLRMDGFKKVAQGETTIDEVLRVTESTI
jgi:type IV pilus assembly protein PilB